LVEVLGLVEVGLLFHQWESVLWAVCSPDGAEEVEAFVLAVDAYLGVEVSSYHSPFSFASLGATISTLRD